MSEQTAAEHPSKAHERPAVADRAFVTPAATDYLTIKAEDCIPEGKATFLQTAFCYGAHVDSPNREEWAATFDTRLWHHS